MEYRQNGAIKVFLCDERRLFRQGMRKLLEVEDSMHVVGEASSGVEMVEMIRRSKPDVILMDINMPEMDGIKTTQRVKKILPNANIIVLTVYDDEAFIYSAIKAGAMGYFLKDVSIEDVIDAIRGVHKGGAIVQPAIAAKVLKEFALRGNRAQDDGKQLCNYLTAREKDVLRLIVLGGTNKAIAQKMGIAEKTVKNHISNIFQTLQVNNRTEAAIYALSKKM